MACVDLLKSRASPRARMWAAACLKHLLRDFYNTPDGSYKSGVQFFSKRFDVMMRIHFSAVPLPLSRWIFAFLASNHSLYSGALHSQAVYD